MSNKARNTSGKFAPKSEEPRKVRSVNLTDDAWQWLAVVAQKAGMSRNDYLEALAEGSEPFMEMVKPQTQAFMEMVSPEPQPFIEMVDIEREVDEVNIEKQPNIELYPFIETVLTEVESLKLELEAVRAENQLLQMEKANLQNGSKELRSQLETERASREKLQKEFDELNKQHLSRVFVAETLENEKSATANELPEAADLLNQLKGQRKKSRADLPDIEVILELLNQAGSSL